MLYQAQRMGEESYARFGRLRAWKPSGGKFAHKFSIVKTLSDLEVGDMLSLVGGGEVGAKENPFHHWMTSPITGMAFEINGNFIIQTENNKYIIKEYLYEND